MNERVKTWIENTYENCIRFNSDPKNAVSMCYGALMFVESETSDEELGRWWDNEMHPKFRELGVY